MKTQTIGVLFSFIVMLALTGCAAKSTLTAIERDEAYAKFVLDNNLERTDKITSFSFDQWSSLGRKHLILYRNFRSPYLITLKHNCFDLEDTFQLAVEYSGSTLRAKSDAVIIPDLIPLKCHIQMIHKLTVEQKEQMMAIGKPTKNDDTSLEVK